MAQKAYNIHITDGEIQSLFAKEVDKYEESISGESAQFNYIVYIGYLDCLHDLGLMEELEYNRCIKAAMLGAMLR